MSPSPSFMRCLFAFVIIAATGTRGLFRSEFDLCKLTNSGAEYVGSFAQTASNEPCQPWNEIEPHPIPFNFTGSPIFLPFRQHYRILSVDDKFPDGNKTAAQNFCRNPDNSEQGPWCYPLNPLKDREPCKVPTCSNDLCRWTGLGLEYSGRQKSTLEQKECSPWSTDASVFRELDKYNHSFPEGSRVLASRGCRNPTEDDGGPWCFVAAGPDISEDVDYVKQYCDVPFCFPLDRITVIGDMADCYFSHYTAFRRNFDDSGEVIFKLWDPGDWDKAELRISLSALPIPATGAEMRAMSFGYEIIIKNRGATITRNKEEESVSVNDTRLISGLAWTRLTIYVSDGTLCLKFSGDDLPFVTHDLREPEATIIGFQGLKYISYKSNVLMLLYSGPREVADGVSKAEKDEILAHFDEYCPKHYTNAPSFVQYYPIRKATINDSRYLNFFARGYSITVKLSLTPSISFPFILIEITRSGFTIIGVMKGVQFSIAQEEVPDFICYWRWIHMEIELTGSRMVFSVHYRGGLQVMLDQTHPEFAAMRWFSVASSSQAVWTFYCEPERDSTLERIFPECVGLGTLGEHYIGQQAVTANGYPCFPWVSGAASEYESDEFPGGSKTRAANFCRNPRSEPSGPWCFARLPGGDVSKQECNVRNCTYRECKFTGTGDDYAGTMAVTRANKTCQVWNSNKPHEVHDKLRHDQTVAEGVSQRKRKHNFCRNPSHDAGGPWCYTTDRAVDKDLCDLPDCQVPESCVAVAHGKTSRKVFLDPQKKVGGIDFQAKLWDPLEPAVAKLYLAFYPREGPGSLIFVIGSGNGEYLKLYFVDELGGKSLLKQTSMPHVLSTVKWTGLKLFMKGSAFTAKFSNAQEPFFTWRYMRPGKYYQGLKEDCNGTRFSPFTPAYFSYGSSSSSTVGLKFPCDDCHTEIVTGNSSKGNVFYPMNLWSGEWSIPYNSMLKIYVRGSGAMNLSLYTLPSSGPVAVRFTLNEIDEYGVNRFAVYTRKKKSLDRVYYGTVEAAGMFSMAEWTEFKVDIVSDKQAFLRRNGQVIAYWIPKEPVYFFTVESGGSDVLYTVNCAPPDLDIPIIDGGWSHWSPWTCSASCGRGRGFRTRTCTNPVPSILGEGCKGESFEVGNCNDFPCGRVSPQTMDEINEALRSIQTKTTEVKEGETISLKCSPGRLRMVKSEEPTALVVWEKNSYEVSPPALLKMVDEADFSLIVSNVTRNSTGVYACMLHAQGILTAIEIFTVIVRSIKPRRKIAGTKLMIPTNAIVLGRIYDRLRVEWIHNDEFHDSYDFDLEDEVVEAVRHLKKEHDGIWECRVIQENLERNWTTNVFMLEVVQKSTWFSSLIDLKIDPTELMNKFPTNNPEMWVFSGILVVFIMCTCKGLFICLRKLCRRTRKSPCYDTEPLMKKSKGVKTLSKCSSKSKQSSRSKQFSGSSRKPNRRSRCATPNNRNECFPTPDFGSTA